MTSSGNRRAIGLEGMVCTLTVLKVCSDDLGVVERELRAKVEQLPNFFQDGPVIIDLAAVEGSIDDPDAPPLCPLALSDLVQVLRRLALAPIGVRNPREGRMAELQALGLAPMWASAPRVAAARREAPSEDVALDAAAEEQVAQAPQDAPSPAPVATPRPALTLRNPLRGGQVAYAEGTDAIALAAVNSGGELIADGNVHVYGPLRGRAVAGVHGDEQARIFCQSLEAELVSIAGIYLGADDLPESHRGKPAKIRLQDERLVVEDL
ncbi:MAG: septum site-determining protein MinC [Myxococcales bacterium]|nr:septum site-determining protein MinC [Myxococcales bacterium]